MISYDSYRPARRSLTLRAGHVHDTGIREHPNQLQAAPTDRNQCIETIRSAM
jgi:hypothetical protein